MSKATKWRKDKLQELADEQMFLPGIDYFVGRERSMQEMLAYARPQIEKLLVKQRNQAVDAINKATSDIQDQYKEAITKRMKLIMPMVDEAKNKTSLRSSFFFGCFLQ